jgi:acetyl-CoA carboxylase biotin carboxyl carrier protein
MTKKDQDADVSFIQALAEMLRENDLTELQVKRDYGADQCLNVRVSRHTAVAAPAPTAVAAPAAPAPVPAPVAAAETAASATPEDPAKHPVGTAYLRPEPGAAPFVSVGDQVKEGQTLLIIEAMKTMNQIPAPKAGKVSRILVEDASPVEYGSPLVIIE